MIFFGKDILNNIVDTTPTEELADKIEEYKRDLETIFIYFGFGSIGIDYIQNLLAYSSNQVAFYCFDSDIQQFNVRNCPSCMIYSKQNKKNTDEIVYYIMIICTDKQFQKQGYATKLLNGFVERVREETRNSTKSVKIILSALDEVVYYYQKYGFEAVDFDLDNYPYLRRFEKKDETKLYTIMEMEIK